MRMIASASALLVGLLAAACNGEVVGGGQRPARVEVVSGDMQSDTVGKEVAQPLVVRVEDERGKPVRNQLRTHSITANSTTTGTIATTETPNTYCQAESY